MTQTSYSASLKTSLNNFYCGNGSGNGRHGEDIINTCLNYLFVNLFHFSTNKIQPFTLRERGRRERKRNGHDLNKDTNNKQL